MLRSLAGLIPFQREVPTLPSFPTSHPSPARGRLDFFLTRAMILCRLGPVSAKLSPAAKCPAGQQLRPSGRTYLDDEAMLCAELGTGKSSSTWMPTKGCQAWLLPVSWATRLAWQGIRAGLPWQEGQCWPGRAPHQGRTPAPGLAGAQRV